MRFGFRQSIASALQVGRMYCEKPTSSVRMEIVVKDADGIERRTTLCAEAEWFAEIGDELVQSQRKVSNG